MKIAAAYEKNTATEIMMDFEQREDALDVGYLAVRADQYANAMSNRSIDDREVLLLHLEEADNKLLKYAIAKNWTVEEMFRFTQTGVGQRYGEGMLTMDGRHADEALRDYSQQIGN